MDKGTQILTLLCHKALDVRKEEKIPAQKTKSRLEPCYRLNVGPSFEKQLPA